MHFDNEFAKRGEISDFSSALMTVQIKGVPKGRQKVPI